MKWDQDVLQCGACETTKPGNPKAAPAGEAKQKTMVTSGPVNDKVQVYKNTALVLYILAYALFIVALALPIYKVRPHHPNEVCPAFKDKEYMKWNESVHIQAALNGEVSAEILLSLLKCQEAQPEYTQTIFQSIQTLFDESSYFPGILIILFTLVLPILKGLFCFYDLLMWGKSGEGMVPVVKPFAFTCVVILSKFAMMDVYVIALIVAFTSFSGSSIPLDFTPEAAFYIFAAYVLLALLGVTLHGKAREGREVVGRAGVERDIE